jgi:hypothetical protein
MKQLLALWPVVVAVVSAGMVATYLGCPGCIDRNRVNVSCEWMGDSAFPIDPQKAAHQTHLVADAQLAEELAVRHADAEHERLFGSYGHGGLIDHGRVRNACMSRLLATIENTHAVTLEQIAVARGQRSWPFDLAVELLFLPLYCLGAAAVCLALDRRFSSDQRYVWFLASALSSIAASFIGLQVGELWLAVWEVVRVGNGHMSSFRAATWNRWSQQHHGFEAIVGVLLFWIIALFVHRAVSGDEPSTSASTPHGALLG